MTDRWDAKTYRPLGRDFQRTKVYKAEREFRVWQNETSMIGEQIHCYALSVVQDRWLIDRFGEIRFKVQTSGRRKYTACCSKSRKDGTFTLKFPAKSSWITRVVVLHELAHIITDGQHHGPIFCLVLLQLVIHFLGADAGHEFYKQYRMQGVHLC